jgi:hypothetical protein
MHHQRIPDPTPICDTGRFESEPAFAKSVIRNHPRETPWDSLSSPEYFRSRLSVLPLTTNTFHVHKKLILFIQNV